MPENRHIEYSSIEAANALVNVIGSSKWNAVAYAHGFIAKSRGASDDDSARLIYNHGPQSLKHSKEFIRYVETLGLISYFKVRSITGSAANPITKLFPATITEQRFQELLDDICSVRDTLSYQDERDSRNLADFTISEGDLTLPINIKNAGTKFLRSQELVGLNPDDCIPIPAYKAYGALDVLPELLYVISVDYDLLPTLDRLLPELFNTDESIVWDLLNQYTGSKVRDSEDTFIWGIVKKHWERIKEEVESNPFHVISARKAIRILHSKPKRTPGIGLRAWGTGANAEVNVHISINEETTAWETVSKRLAENGVTDIVSAINRKRTEIIYDPEI